MRKPMIPALVLLATAGLVALTGCTGSGAPAGDPSEGTSASQAPAESSAAAEGDQSLEEACAIANEAALSLQSDANAALADPTNQEAVSSALDSVSSGLSDALEEISNPEVEAAVGDLQSRFAAFGDMLTQLQSGEPTQEQVAAIQTAAADLQTSANNVRELCS